MAILQAVLSLVSRSFGKILSAVFGWAVVALFGQTSGQKKMWLSALVAAAAAWPLLLLGIVAPRLASLVLAFVPIPGSVPDWAVRAVWIALAVAVPCTVGLVMAVRPPTGNPTGGVAREPARESAVTRMIRGIPITFGVAVSFLIVFVTVPALRIVSFVRRRTDVQVPLVTDAQTYEAVAEKIGLTLHHHGFEAQRTEAPWWMTAPSRVLQWCDRQSFDAYVPEHFAYFDGPRLTAALYPNGLLLRGSANETTWAQGVVIEALTPTPGLQTFDPAAQDIERQIRRVWVVYRENPAAHRRSTALLGRLQEIAAAIRRLQVTYDEWQIVYRQALQLGRALGGDPQLLDLAGAGRGELQEADMEQSTSTEGATVTPITRARASRAEALSTRELLGEITGKATLLVKKEVELARNEIKADLQAELAVVKGFAIALVAGLGAVNMLLVAVVFALARVMPGWLAALVVAGVVLLIAGVVAYLSWGRRVTSPLQLTRKTLKEDAQWAKERLA
jgi:hypothetical protein